MSSVKEAATLCENGATFEGAPNGQCAGWRRDGRLGRASIHTQTALLPKADKETQTSSPVILRMDLERTPSKPKHGSLVETDGTVAPFFHFDRQAPARISTSPTLRRMRTSIRIPRTDGQEPSKVNSTREDSATCGVTLSGSSFSPAERQRSPLAEPQHFPPHKHDRDAQPDLSPVEVRNRSSRANTLDNSEIRRRQESFNIKESNSSEGTDDSDQAKESSHKWLQERRRSSVVISLPGLDVSPGDLFVSNGAGILNSPNISDTKKSKWPFSRRSTQAKGKSSSLSDMEKHLSNMQVQDWRETDFQRYKDCPLEIFLKIHGCEDRGVDSTKDYRREEAVWELFTSECVYFLDQLMVLKEVFLNTLISLQMSDCLQDIDPWRLFANLNELCLVSFDFLTSLLRVIKQSWAIPVAGTPLPLPSLLSKGFRESICHCQQKYCLNYSTATFYIESLKQRDDFVAYMKWCESHPECRRLQLRDLLVAPMQRLTRYPLLLRNICKRSSSEQEQQAVETVAEMVDRSIQDLEGKVKWLENYQNIRQLKECLIWPQVWEQNKRGFIPENLKHLLKAVSLDNLVTQRSLLYEGKLSLVENSKLREVCLFLFEEFLLITKVKRGKKRTLGSEQSGMRPPHVQELHTLLQEGCTFTVLDQPISLDRLQLRNVDQLNAAASGIPNSFVIMHQNRYQQVIAVFILQAPSEAIKKSWMSAIERAIVALQAQDSQKPRVKSTKFWLESSQI
uniref:Pleckstrin homology domain containing, family G (with RhoGef domain) member 7 n=2 Tax=Scleropages formosus TaxID=113540 RepID=A0A8C9TF19_SCLFO